MEITLRRAKNVTYVTTALFMIIASIFVLFGALIVQAIYFVLMGFVGSALGGAIAVGYFHLVYKRLAEDCNCPVEDIYYAIEVAGWQTGWIRNNIPSFSSHLAEEKRKRAR